MIKEYYEFPGYVWCWDTDACKWSKRQKYVPKEQAQFIFRSDWSDLTWYQLLFEIYKKHRASLGWGDIVSCHDEEDQQYFKTLDLMTGGSNGVHGKPVR